MGPRYSNSLLFARSGAYTPQIARDLARELVSTLDINGDGDTPIVRGG